MTTKTASVVSRRAVLAATRTFCKANGTSRSLTVEIPLRGETIVRKARVVELNGYMHRGAFVGTMTLVPTLHPHDEKKLGTMLRKDGTVHLSCHA